MNLGGKEVSHGKGEHRALQGAEVYALDGKWNRCEVIVMGRDFAVQKLNGKVVNVITNLVHAEGPIALQAETAEIFYRNIRIEEFAEAKPLSDFFQVTEVEEKK